MSNKTRVDDDELIRIANTFKMIPSIEDGNLTNTENIELNNFIFYSQNNSRNNKYEYEVKSSINVDCSHQEIINIFNTNNEYKYNIFMREFYKDNFINGCLVHTIQNNKNQVMIKKCCFKQSGILSSMDRNDNWCYIEEYIPSINDIIITLTTIDENKILYKNGIVNINQIRHLQAMYIIKIIYENINLDIKSSIYNISFHGYINNNSKILKRHLKCLAKGLKEIPNVIIKHRLSYQLKANLALCKIANTSCISCSKKIRLQSIKWMKKRCQLCSHNACYKCAIKKEIFAENNENKLMNICLRCFECVNRCNYSNIDGKIINRLIPDDSDIPHAGIRILQYLKDKLSKDNERDEVMHILEYIPPVKKAKKQVTIDESQNIYNSFISDYRYSEDSIYSSTFLEYRNAEIIDNLEEYLNDIPMLEDCELSNCDFRSYPIETATANNPNYLMKPKPENEELRLIDVNKVDIKRLGDINELSTICEVINQEMQCLGTMITIIGEESLHVVACNNKDFINIYPREETMCQHTIMNNKPMLVNNPEVDIRYHNLEQVKKFNVKFYFGAPLKSINNHILGTLCCVDTDIKTVSVSQYSIISKLANTVSKIIEKEACRFELIGDSSSNNSE